VRWNPGVRLVTVHSDFNHTARMGAFPKSKQIVPPLRNPAAPNVTEITISRDGTYGVRP